MNLKINTIELQTLVAKAEKGVGDNKLIPLTSLMNIQVVNGMLTLVTTDGTNYVYVKKKIDANDFYAVVPADIFIKLISRLTCETVELEIENQSLIVKGNGTYLIELPLDNEGNLIKYLDPLKNIDPDTKKEQTKLSTKLVKDILSGLASSLAVTLEVPCYTEYYFGDRIIATDTYKIASIQEKVFNTPQLISSQLMELLSIMDEEFISVQIYDGAVVFESNSCWVYGRLSNNVSEFASDSIESLLVMDFGNSAKLDKNELIRVLDRLILFVTQYDRNVIRLVFDSSGVTISSNKSTGEEYIKFLESKTTDDEFACNVDIEMLQDQIKATSSDVINISFGNSKAIRFDSNGLCQLLALVE